jgi:hypothetical protein
MRGYGNHNLGGPAVRYIDVMAQCPKHGLTLHLGCAGGRCCRCQQEGLEAQGLVKADPPRPR